MKFRQNNKTRRKLQEIRLRLFLVSVFVSVFTGVWGQTELVPPDSVNITERWTDKNGENTLRIAVSALCIPEKTFPMGFESGISVTLENERHKSDICFELEDYQMQMLLFYKDDLKFFDIKGTTAVFVPFFYCGNSDATIRVSYIIMYNGSTYLKHIDFRCTETGTCSPSDDFSSRLSDMPKILRKKLMGELEKYRDVKDFHEDRGW